MVFPRDSQIGKFLACEDAVAEKCQLRFEDAYELSRFAEVVRYTDPALSRLVHECHVFFAPVACEAWIQKRSNDSRSVAQVPAKQKIGRLGVLHGFAHILAPATHFHAAHGPDFCRMFAEMVERYMSGAPSQTLQVEYRAKKVKTIHVSAEEYARHQAIIQERKDRALDRKAALLESRLTALVRKYR